MLGWLQDASDAVLLLDPGGSLIHANRAATERLGPDAVQPGTPFSAAWPADLHADVDAAVAEALAGGVGRLEARPAWRPDGRGAWLEFVLTPIRDAAPDGPAVLAIGRDVSARRHLVDDLRRAEAQVRLAAQLAGVSLTAQDRQQRYTWVVNPRAARLSELLGRTFDEFAQRPEDARAAREVRQRVLDTGEPLEVQQEFLLGDQLRTFDLRLEPIRDEDGDVVGVLTAALDVTDRLHREAALAKGQRMEAVTRLAGGVSHQLNNLLTVIDGTATLIGETASPDARAWADDLLSATRRLGRLAAVLLTIGRGRPHRPALVDLHERMRALEPALRTLLAPSIAFELRLSGPRPRVRIDVAQLEEALVHLAANSRDFVPVQGRVVASVRHLDDAPPPGEVILPCPTRHAVVLTVADDGPGIAPEIRRSVFEPYATTRPGRSGLGLSAVYSIVQQAGGGLVLDSAPGAGTRVHLVLATHAAEQGNRARGEATPEPLKASAPRRILVVDDEPVVLRLMQHVLTSAGFHVHALRCPQQALALASTLDVAPDLVVTDVLMPHMDGPTLAAELGRLWPTVPVLYVSGYAGDDGAGGSALPHDADLLPKPFSAPELLRRVRAILGART